MSQKTDNLDLGGPAGQVLAFLLGYIATRILDAIKPKRRHVVGAIAMGTGWSGLALFSAMIYVWNVYVVPPNVLIAVHSGFHGLPLLTGVLLPNLNFGLMSWFLVVLEFNGIVLFSTNWWPAKAVRRFPLVSRFVTKRDEERPHIRSSCNLKASSCSIREGLACSRSRQSLR